MPAESLSPQEANDLLHKLITESTRVQGAFVSPVSGVRTLVWGVIGVSSTGLLNIVERGRMTLVRRSYVSIRHAPSCESMGTRSR
jgi:hypothetical protein